VHYSLKLTKKLMLDVGCNLCLVVRVCILLVFVFLVLVFESFSMYMFGVRGSK